MILGDLFESRMSNLDIEYQDWKNMEPVAFYSRYKMTKSEWYNKHQSLVPAEGGVQEGAEDYAEIYSPEAIALGKRFCEHYNITDDNDVQLAVEIIDSYIDQFKASNTPIDLKVIKSGVADAFRQVYRGMGPGPSFRKKFQETTARERWNKASAERQKKHDEIEALRQAAAKQGRTDVPGAIKRLEKALGEATQELTVGDPVIIQGTEYDGKTGEIGEFSPSGRFVVVDLYNYGPQAFNLANVKYNEYADDEDQFNEEKRRLDPKCWTGKKIGNPNTKMKGGVRVNNCVPVEEEQLDELTFLGSECTKDCSGHRAGYNWSKQRGGVDGMSPWSPSFNKGAALAKAGK